MIEDIRVVLARGEKKTRDKHAESHAGRPNLDGGAPARFGPGPVGATGRAPASKLGSVRNSGPTGAQAEPRSNGDLVRRIGRIGRRISAR